MNSLQQVEVLRGLGALESFYWKQNQAKPRHFLVVAKIRGTAERADWRAAVDAVQSRHPLLQATIAADQNGRPFFVRKPGQSIGIRFLQGDSQTPWERAAEWELDHPLPRESGLGIALSVLTYESHSIVIMALDHTFGDGMSCLFMIRDLLVALSGGSLEALPTPPPQESAIASIKARDVSVQPDRGSDPSERFHPTIEIRPARVQTAVVNSDLLAALLQRCHQEGTTVQGALVAAFVLAGAGQNPSWENQPLRIMTAINARRYTGHQEEVVLSVNAHVGAYRADAPGGFWGLARQAYEDLQLATTRESVLGQLHEFEDIMRSDDEQALLGVTAKMANEIKISNLGVWRFPTQYGDFQLEDLWGPSILHRIPGEQSLGVATVNHRLHLIHASTEPIPKLLESAVAALGQAVDAAPE